MNASRFPMLAAAALVAAGCANAVEGPSSDMEETAATAAPQAQGVALRLEQAERSLDVGRDAAGALAAIEGVIADPAATPEQRDQARLALSRAHEAVGDHEAAIAAVEALLAAHPDGTHFPVEEAAEARLRKLVTGSDTPPERHPEDTRQASDFARALAKYFPVPATGKAIIDIRILAFGGNGEVSDRLGTFAIDRAVRDLRREQCPLCQDRLGTSTSSGRTGSWVGIPRDRPLLGKALAVYYFDLGNGRIPARYDAELPLPSADIAARLAKGDGLVAVKERPGAPPAVLIAAPREAQLADVEEALSAMKTIPAEPVAVPLKGQLKPQEIQTVVRGNFAAFHQCYETLLASNAAATGRIKVHFSIRGDGTTDAISAETDGTLHDAAFEGCVLAGFRGLSFPATHAATPTTVTYPIMFSP